MQRIKEKDLTKIVTEVLRKAGSEEAEAAMVAKHLVLSDLCGHESHGVGMIPYYLQYISQGILNPNTPAKLIKDEDAILVFDGQRGYGQRTAHEAMEKAISKCKEKGFAVMALRNAQHIGRVGTYGEQSIKAGLVSIHFVNVIDHDPIVVPFGGRDARYATNPVCMAMPGTENTAPVLLDMATSKIPIGKARVAMEAGKQLADDQLLDPEGNPTNDPSFVFSEPKGALIPFGLHKGYGIALFCELLAGVLTGGGTIQPENERLNGIVNNMLAFLVDPKRLVDHQWMCHEIDAIVSFVKESPPRDPDNPVMVAGDPERKSLAERRKNGIPVDPVTLEGILAGGETVGIERSELESYIS